MFLMICRAARSPVAKGTMDRAPPSVKICCLAGEIERILNRLCQLPDRLDPVYGDVTVGAAANPAAPAPMISTSVRCSVMDKV